MPSPELLPRNQPPRTFTLEPGARSRPSPLLLAVETTPVSTLCAAPAAASAFPNLTGSWQTNYHCEVGWCAGDDFPATAVLSQAKGSDVVTGSKDAGKTGFTRGPKPAGA